MKLRGILWLVALLVVAPTTAQAHEDATLTAANAWSAWHLTPAIVIPTLLVALIYGAGMLRRRGTPIWRHGLFLAGLALVFASLQSPVDPVAERLFWMHQIQHLLLRMAGPMLIALAMPPAVLVAGLPHGHRRRLLAPVISSRVVRALFGFLFQPVVAVVLFIAALYLWQVPSLHNAALLDEDIHNLMHATMLAAGLIFWWRIFEFRAPPRGLRYGFRMMLLWLVVLSNIVLGAWVTLSNGVLYDAYDVLGRLGGYAARTDEEVGGVIIWVPGSMMCLLAMLGVIHMWARHEAREADHPVRRAMAPTTGAQMVARARPRNRLMLVGFGAFVIVMFAFAILSGVLAPVRPTRATPQIHAAAPTR